MNAVTAVITDISVTNPDESRFYPYPLTGQSLDSVTTIISGTDRKPWIAKWYGRQSTAWCADHARLLTATLKVLGRKAAIALGQDAAEAERKIKAQAGVHVHDVQQALILWAASRDGEGGNIALPLLPEHLRSARYDLGKGESAKLTDVVDWMVDGFINFVTLFDPEFLATEMPVYNQPLGWAGTLDAIIILRGYAISYGTGPKGADEIVACPGSILVICVDTKTGKNPEGTWKEQLAAYRRATECAPSLGELRPMPPTHCGAVLHLRPDHIDGFSLMLVSSGDDEAAYARFEKAASIYRERQEVKDKPGPAFRPLRADGTMPGPRLGDVRGEGYDQVLTPLRAALGPAAELSEVAAFTAAELLGVRGVGKKRIGMIREMLADQRPPLYLKGEEPAAELAMAGAVAA